VAGMNKKTLYVTAILLVGLFIFYTFPRFGLCYLYHSIISKPSALETLRIKPEKIEIPESNHANLFSFGYAETNIKPASIQYIKYYKKTGLTFGVDSNEITYFFLMPQRPDDLTYDVEVQAANVLPMKYSTIFFMNCRTACERIMTANILKISNPHNQRGIGLFETKQIKGLIRFGTQKNPGSIIADIYSKDDNISQIIGVSSCSAEKSKNTMIEILSSYRYVIEDANDVNTTNELIMNQFSNDSKFTIEDSNGR
jgi:hypothetical protein